MKRIKKKILGFCLLASSLYLLAFFVLSRLTIGAYPIIYALSDGLNLKGGNTYQKFLEFDSAHIYDAIILGSSHAYRGYDPRIFEAAGYDVFNLGTSSQTPMNSFYLAEAYLNNSNCGLLILDVFHVGFQLDGLESCADLIQNISSDKPAKKMLWAMKDPRVLNMCALRSVTGSVKPYYLDTAYTRKGFSENHNRRKEGVIYPQDGPFLPKEKQLEYFARLIGLCQERGIPLVFVDHPIPEENGSQRSEQAHAQINEMAKQMNIPFIYDLEGVQLDPQMHYYDHTHLNSAGVQLFNQRLIKELKALELLH